jgi:diguanylate cyclase (GGDEF)-like protein
VKKGLYENMNAKRKFKILIADDEKANLDVLIHILKDSYIVYPAKSGEAVLRKAADISPDLILLDIIMPDMNGYDVLQRLKSDDLTEHIPVMFISGLSNIEDEKRGLRLGAADYITKPFNNEMVKARVKTQLQLLRHMRMLEEVGMIDELTGLPNRKSFDHQLMVEWARAVREKTPVSLIMIDVDDFGFYKKTYGADNAQQLLLKTASVINARLKRTTDVKARYSDTVFAIILPNTPKNGALKVAEDIMKGMREMMSADNEKATLSIGISGADPDKDDPVSYFVLQADRNLYKAKTEGNLVCY